MSPSVVKGLCWVLLNFLLPAAIQHAEVKTSQPSLPPSFNAVSPLSPLYLSTSPPSLPLSLPPSLSPSFFTPYFLFLIPLRDFSLVFLFVSFLFSFLTSSTLFFFFLALFYFPCVLSTVIQSHAGSIWLLVQWAFEKPAQSSLYISHPCLAV